MPVSTEGMEAKAARAVAGATILQAIPALQDDAIGQTALNVAYALLRAGARALVAGAGGPLVGELQALGGEWVEFDFKAPSAFRGSRNVRALAELIAAERIDILHALGLDVARTATAALRQGAQASLVTSYLGVPPPPSWRKPPQDVMARGRIVAALSEFGADLIAERHGVPRERIVVIPNSVDTGWFDPATVTRDRIVALRQAWRIGTRDQMVLVPERIAEGHGHETLVDAVRILVNGGLRGAVFVITGSPAENDEKAIAALDARIAAQGLRAIFRRVGQSPDMPATYALADLVVLPVERPIVFSIAAAEAQSMGRPLIASEIGALPEFLRAPPRDPEPTRTGWLVRPGDALDLARTLAIGLAISPATRTAMAHRARDHAQAHFSAAHATGATLAVYGLLLEKRR
jgi:glycosyltransferase involved in cell wall biosynthesis